MCRALRGTRSFPRIHPPQKGVVFTNSLVVLMMMMYRLYWHVEPLFGSDSWYALDFLDLFLLHKTLSYSWELLRTTEMTWRWAMWLYFSSRSGRGERTFSWKPSVRFASKEISSMRTSSAMLQVSFLWMRHNHFWMFSTVHPAGWTILVEILLFLFVGKGGGLSTRNELWQLLCESQWRFRVQGIRAVVPF